MCFAIKDGGKRCPLHRNETKVLIHDLAEKSDLSKTQIESLFLDERKKHDAETTQHWESLKKDLDNIAVPQRLSHAKEGINGDTPPDPQTVNTLHALTKRTHERAYALNKYLKTLADTQGKPVSEVKAYYEQTLSKLTRHGRKLTEHEDYTEGAYLYSKDTDLPSDPASIIALHQTATKFKGNAEYRPLIHHIPARKPVESYGYSPQEKRLELKIDGHVFAYRNIPNSVWHEITNPRTDIAELVAVISSNEAYKYPSALQEKVAGRTPQCTSCGQFKSSSHTCPERNTQEYTNTLAGTQVIIPVDEQMDSAHVISETPKRPHGRPRSGSIAYTDEPHYLAIREELGPDESDDMIDAWIKEGNFTGDIEDQEQDPHSLDLENIEVKNRRTVLNDYQGRYLIIKPERYAEVENVPADVPQYKNSAMLVIIDHNSVMHYVQEFKRGNYTPTPDGQTLTQRGNNDRRAFKSEEARDAYLEQQYNKEEISDLERRAYIEDEELIPLAINPPTFRLSGEETIEDSEMEWGYGVTAEELNDTWENGEAWESDLMWTGTVTHPFIDGYHEDMPMGSFCVTGKLAVYREDDGDVLAASGEHELRCDCHVYAQRYTCQHIRYALNYVPSLARGIADPKYGKGLAPEDNPYSEELNSSPDFTIRKNGEQIIGVVKELDFVSTSEIFTSSSIRIPSRPDADANDAQWNAYAEQLQHARDARNIIEGYTTLEMSHYDTTQEVLAAQTPVDVHVYARNLSTDAFTLDGYVTIAQEGSTANVAHKQLRCSCGRFVSTNGCNHVNMAVEAVTRRYNGGYDATERITASAAELDNYTEDLKILNKIKTLQEDTPNPFKTAEKLIKDENEERIRVQAEQEAQQQALLAKELELLDEEIEHYENIADELAHEVAQRERDWEEQHPEYSEYKESRLQEWKNIETITEHEVQSLLARPISVPTMYENVTDGICDPSIPGSRKFGLEIEMTFDGMSDEEKKIATQKIVEEVRSLGLTDQNHVGIYHEGNANNWTQWTIEEDLTVDLEIVTPPLSDTPEDWKNLEKVLEIAKKHGGRPSPQAGLHVNVSTGSLAGNYAAHVELSRNLKEHEDVLFKASTNPKTGTHRGVEWCMPHMPIPNIEVGRNDSNGIINKMTLHTGEGYRKQMVNITNSLTDHPDENARAEVRIWDSTLDINTIQHQVAISAALIDHAERTITARGSSKPRKTNIERGTNSNDEYTPETISNITDLANKLFRKNTDKNRLISLVSTGSWADKADENLVNLAEVFEAY